MEGRAHHFGAPAAWFGLFPSASSPREASRCCLVCCAPAIINHTRGKYQKLCVPSAKGEASKESHAQDYTKSFFLLLLRHEFIFLLHPHSASDSKNDVRIKGRWFTIDNPSICPGSFDFLSSVFINCLMEQLLLMAAPDNPCGNWQLCGGFPPVFANPPLQVKDDV